MFIWYNNTLFVLFLQLTMARTKLRLSSYIRKRKGIGVRNIPAKKIKNDSLSNKIYLPPSTTNKTHKCQICEKLHVKFQNHRLKHNYLVKKLMIWFVIVIMTLRLEVKSQKGSRNHFREDGMLTFVTHANY